MKCHLLSAFRISTVPYSFVPFSVRSSLADIYESSFIGIGSSSSMILAENLRNEGTNEDLRDLNNKAEL